MDRLSNSSDYKIHHHNKRMSEAAAAAVQSGSVAPVYVRKSSTGPRSWFSQTLNRLRGTTTRRGGPTRRHYLANSLASPNSDLEHSPGVSRRYSSGPSKRFLTGDAQEIAASLSSADRRSGCRWTFVFDPSGRLAYYWSMVVSIAFLYNLWVIVYRFSFQEITRENLAVWMPLDYFADFLYICDIAFNFRTGYLEDGVLQTETLKLRQHYMNTTLFYVDCLCLLPLDFLYLSLGFNSALRGFRLVKIYRFWVFLDKSERHTNYPNVFRSLVLIHYLLVLFHWNACIFYMLSTHFEFRADWAKTEDQSDTVRHYMHSLYWSTLFLTNIGDIPRPLTRVEYIFVITELIVGLLLFATVLGHVANIVTSVSAARKEFQAKLDNVKTYMNLRRVPDHLQKKVIKWFDYLRLTKKSSDEEKAVMSCLPDKLKAEIAIHVHLDTLKRVEIFQNTEAGFLCELVLRLRPVLFSPGDYICRKGEVGKEMYIVARGKLQVVADNGRTVLATLRAGSYFGEISVLNMGTLGNRRTASVRSVGYSDLFCLSKQDMWDVLQEYPAARVRLEGIAQKRLRKYEKSPLEKGPTTTINRSQSTPGLVEPHLHPEDNPTMDRATFVRIQSAMSMPSGLPRTASSMTPIEEAQPLVQSPPATAHIMVQPSLHQPQPEPPSMSRPTLSVPSALPLASSQAGAGYHSPQPHSMYNLASTSSYTNHLAVPSTSHRSLPNGQSRSTTPGTMLADDARSLMGNSTTEADFVAEIQRLRERLAQLEAENGSLNTKLNQQQWEVEHRLQEIEMHICGSDSPSGSDFSELTPLPPNLRRYGIFKDDFRRTSDPARSTQVTSISR